MYICIHITSGKFPMDLGIPPHEIKNLLESDPLKSGFLVRRLTGLVRSVPEKDQAGRMGPDPGGSELGKGTLRFG